MATLTSTATLTVGDASVAIDTVAIPVVAVPGAGEGTGRLIHPSLGTYDYARAPNEWSNMHGDVIIPPIWSSQKTLLGSANTLFAGDIRDVTVEECWAQSTAAMEVAMLEMLLSFWMNPPDPRVAFVQWYPSYDSTLAFNVILLDLTVKGRAVTLDSLSHAGWVRGPVVLRMKIVGRL